LLHIQQSVCRRTSQSQRSWYLKTDPYSSGYYTGDWTYNRPNGKGTFQSYNGETYEGNWVDGYRHGYGEYSYNYTGLTAETFAGEWDTGYKVKGKTIFANTGTYEGDYKRNGWEAAHGKFTALDGTVFEGIYFSDRAFNGTINFSNGDKYTGGVEGQRSRLPLMHGLGVYEFNNGTTLDTEWVHNIRVPTLMERLGHAEAVLDDVENFVNSVSDTYEIFSKMVDSVSDAMNKIF